MQIITQEQKEVMNFRPMGPNRREKSPLRLSLEALETGQIALYKNGGEDYKTWAQMYSAVRAARKTLNCDFKIEELADKSGAVVTRIT